jgi:hypothetical protein
VQRRVSRLLLMLWAVSGAATGGGARADVLLDQTILAGLPTVAAPFQYSFTAATAQALTLTLNDFQIPAAFDSLQVAVTLNDTLIGSGPVNSSGVATVTIPAAVGNYSVFVIGTPNAAQGFGSFGVCVAPSANAKSCIAAYSNSGNIQTPSTVSTSGTSTLNTNFVSTGVAGIYTVTVTDDVFPVALANIAGGITQGATSVGALSAGPNSVPLAANTSYQLILSAIAGPSVSAGLYGVHITDPTGAVVFDRTLPVGTMPASTIVDAKTTQALTLSLTDYGYPSALSTVGVAVTEGSSALATLVAPGTVNNFMAPAGSVEIWQFAIAGAQPGVYGVVLSPYPASAGSVDLFSTNKVINPPATTSTSYAFIATLASAGTFTLLVNDFGFPFPFQSLGPPTVAQNGVVLPLTSGSFTAAAGSVVVLVDATPSQSGSGIFGVTVQTSGASPQVLLDQTQAVGSVFSTTAVNFGGSGAYDVTLTDLGFPSNFQYLAVVVSQASQVLGKIYTNGTFTFNGTPGQLVFTFITTPTTSNANPNLNNYGLYSVRAASAVPTVKLTASSASVTAGQPVQLTWSSQNATACTASGTSGWTGPEPVSGSTAVAVNGMVTLSLTCTGGGGSAAQSVTVTTTPATSTSGGGGALGADLLALLGAIFMRRCFRRTFESAR